MWITVYNIIVLTSNAEACNRAGRLIQQETSLNANLGWGPAVPGPKPYGGVAFASFLTAQVTHRKKPLQSIQKMLQSLYGFLKKR